MEKNCSAYHRVSSNHFENQQLEARGEKRWSNFRKQLGRWLRPELDYGNLPNILRSNQNFREHSFEHKAKRINQCWTKYKNRFVFGSINKC